MLISFLFATSELTLSLFVPVCYYRGRMGRRHIVSPYTYFLFAICLCSMCSLYYLSFICNTHALQHHPETSFKTTTLGRKEEEGRCPCPTLRHGWGLKPPTPLAWILTCADSDSSARVRCACGNCELPANTRGRFPGRSLDGCGRSVPRSVERAANA